ncbi:MAG: DivIVA domain-containing protein [Lachnospiraceae bacterium]|jgi:cell division initiation protein|nr:DivIVA domain-containing protein [Lachnospiraceae bacterium]
MLTPIDIENKTFKTGIGYDRKDVDAFLIELQESYEKIYKQNLEFREKIQKLSIALKNYKTIEKSLQKALVLAQKAAEETKETARVSAEAIETQAQAKAKDILADAKSDLEEIKLKTQALLSQYNVYKAQYRQILQTQLELLENDSFEIMLEQERGGGVFEEEELAEEE